MPNYSVVSLQNSIAATRSQIASLLIPGSIHENNAKAIGDLRSKLSVLEDQLYLAKMREGLSPQTRSNAPATRYSKGDMSYMLKRYMLTGDPNEYRDLTSADGGMLIPQQLLNIVDALKFYGNIAGEVLVHRGAGYVKIPVVDDTGNSVKVISEGASSTSAEMDPSSITYKQTPASAITANDALVTNIDLSVQELLNGNPQMDTWLRSRVVTRIGRGLEAAVTNGLDGSGTALPASPTGGLLAGLSVGATAAAASEVQFADLAALKDSLDPAYLAGAKYYASTSVYSYVDSLQTTTGAKLFGYDANGVLQVLGLPFLRNTAMAALTATGSKPLVTLGRYDLAYQISLTQPSIRMLTQLPGYAENLLNRYQGVVRLGASALLSTAVKSLVSHS